MKRAIVCGLPMLLAFFVVTTTVLNVETRGEKGHVFLNAISPRTSVLDVTQTTISITLDDQVILENSTLTFDYRLANESTTRDFSSTATLVECTNSSLHDERGDGTRYHVEYANLHVLVTLHVIVYDSLDAVLINATVTPLQAIVFRGEFSLLSVDIGDLLPSVPAQDVQFSFFGDDSIWGDYVRVSAGSDIWWARTPFLAHDATTGLLIAALTSNDWETQVTSVDGKFFLRTVIIDGYEGHAGKNVTTEVAWLQLGSNFSDLFVSYADQVRLFNPPVRTRVVENFYSSTAGECDWYSHYGNINEASVLAELDALERLNDAGYGYYIMDDGWGSNETLMYYNWSTWDPVKFPRGAAPCIEKAHDAGLKFVVWNRIGYAPLWAQQEQPDWIASNGSDPRKDAAFNMSLQAVQAYIDNVFSTWKSQGIDGLKVDFIISGLYWTWSAQVWNQDKTRTGHVNQYLDILDRLAANYNISILLCGTPYGYPSLARYPNLVASRVTGDTMWQGGLHPWQVATTLLRSYWWARAFNTPDPDAYNTNDIRGLLAAAATGGALYHGNDYRRVNDDRARLALKLRWDAPAVPVNIAFCGNTIAVTGNLKGNRAWLLMNLDETTSKTYTITGLQSECSAIKVSTMCSIEGNNGQFTIDARPSAAEMLVFYTGTPPLPVFTCTSIELARVLVLAGPLSLIAIIIFIVYKNKTIKKRN